MATRSRKRSSPRPADTPREPAEPLEPAQPTASPVAPLRPSRAAGRLARRRVLPWSERSVLAISLLLVTVSTPLWLDPSALYELGWGGQPSTGSPVATTAPAAPRPTTEATPARPGRLIASDTFSRRAGDGWGSADVGGRWVLDGQAGLSVEPGIGLIRLSAGDAGSVVLPQASAQEASLELSVAIDRLPTGSGELRLYAELRRNQRGAAYRPVVHVRSDGSLLVGASMRLGSQEHDLGATYRAPDVSLSGGDVLRLRAEVAGSDPTTIRLRVWPAGAAEPSFWHVSVIDWSGALQGSGTIGMGWQLDPAAGDPLTLHIDDMRLTTSDEAGSQ